MEDDGKEKEQHTSIKSVPGGTTKNESEVSSHLYVTIKKKQQHKRGNREKTNSKKKLETRIEPIKFKRKQGSYSFELLKFQDFL